MPILATGPNQTAGQVTQLARALVNDMIVDAEGDTLRDDQPATFPLLNSAYQELQDELIDNGVETFTAELIIPSLPVAATNDPGIQTELSFTGYFDGGTFYPNPTLPPDMIQPLRLWERQSGSNLPFFPMCEGELPSRSALPTFQKWDYRGDAIYLPLTNQRNDLRIRYLSYAPDLVDANSPIRVLRCGNVLAYDLARKYANARGAAISDNFLRDRNEARDHLVRRALKQKQKNRYRRIPYNGRRKRD